MVADHLSRLESPERVHENQVQIDDTFLDEQLLARFHAEFSPWFADIANYLVVGIVPYDLTSQQKKRFFAKVKHYFWDDPILFR